VGSPVLWPFRIEDWATAAPIKKTNPKRKNALHRIMNYTLAQMAQICHANFDGEADAVLTDICYDTRHLFSGQNALFVAMKTAKNDGNKYVYNAVERGICCVMSEEEKPADLAVNWLKVDNCLAALQQLAQQHRTDFELERIGITGSNGKTIIKEWLYQCLWPHEQVVKSPKSFNSGLGLALSLLMIEPEHELGIFEVGISEPNEMGTLEQMLEPQVGILSHIGTAHSENFASEEALILEKLKLFTHSEVIIYNAENALLSTLIGEIYPNKILISYGFDKRFDWHAQWVSPYRCRFATGELSFELDVQNRTKATLLNAMAVAAVLHRRGFEMSEIAHKINDLQAVEMRLETVTGIRNLNIINDSFNLDLDSLGIALQHTALYKKQKKSIILSDILSVKMPEAQLYQKVAQLVNQQKFDEIVLLGPCISQYKEAFVAKDKVIYFDDTAELLDSLWLQQVANQLILLKGARKFELEKVQSVLELQSHDSILEINLNALWHNITIFKQQLKPETKIMAMVKAYAYGLGGYEVAEFLQHHHIDYLGVAYVDEGVDLRRNGISTPILVMNPEHNSFGKLIDFRLEPEIYSFRVLDKFLAEWRKKGQPKDYPIHLKIETGMHRLGFKAHEIPELMARLKGQHLVVKSIFSHLSSSDDANEKAFTEAQLQLFEDVSRETSEALDYQPMRHILNSAGICAYPHGQFEMVRMGIGMMGISPWPAIQKQLQPVVKFKTLISQISEVQAQESIGYNRSHVLQETKKIATIPVGYADGISRSIGNGVASFGIKNKRYPIVGKVCMDMLMLDIGNDDLQEGDEVCLFYQNPSLTEMAAWANTIPYEILTSISRRIKRIYIKD
jgi:Alr-MurF fusion protein